MENNDRVYELMTRKAAGIINDQEEKELDQLLAENPLAQEKWTALQQQFPQENASQQPYEAPVEWLDLSSITEKTLPKYNRVSRILAIISATAAIIAGILLANNILFKKTSLSNTGVTYNTSPTHLKGIALQLANGQTIPLSNREGEMVTETGDTLHFTNKVLSYQNNTHTTAISGTNKLVVPIGMDYRIILSDGSEIRLNSATELQFPFRFSGKTREIFINGEAYVTVAANANQPFFVHTPRGTVQVLGTTFNINTYKPSLLSVALVKGAVRLDAGGKQILLQPGHEAIYKEGAGTRVRPFEVDQVTAWLKGYYVFENAPLSEILTTLPRWYGIQVAIDNPDLSNQLFTGVMDRNAPVEVFLKNLSKTMLLHYYFDTASVLHFK